MKSLKKNSLFVICIAALSVLLASCASEVVSLDASPQGIEVQADESKSSKSDHKSHKKGHDGNKHNKRANPFQLVATTIGIDIETLKTELGADKSIATIAQENGVAAQTIIDALTAKSQTRIDAAIAAGKISTEDASAWQAKVNEHSANFVNNTQEVLSKMKEGRGAKGKGAGDRGGKGNRGAKGKDKFSEIAQLIGIDVKTLYTELKAGKSIADVATANGVVPQTIIDALMVDMQTKLDAMVVAGKLSSDEAAEKASAMKEQVTAWVNGTAKGRK